MHTYVGEELSMQKTSAKAQAAQAIMGNTSNANQVATEKIAAMTAQLAINEM